MRKMAAKSLAELVRMADKLGIARAGWNSLNKPIIAILGRYCISWLYWGCSVQWQRN